VFPRVGTRASFDAEQKNRHQTHRRSHSARMPNIRRARARILFTHPDSRSRGECSGMCGGSIYTLRKYTVDMILEMKFGNQKYSQVSNRVGSAYRGLPDFILLDKYLSSS
jgi:hypothetical protein